jgi:hypothetical protein
VRSFALEFVKETSVPLRKRYRFQAMNATTTALRAARPRDRAEVMEAWRTSCPRLSIWEDACLDGLIDFEPGTGKVILSEAGKASLFR